MCLRDRVDLKEEFLSEIKSEVARLGAEVLTFGADISDYPTVQNIFQQTREKWGSVDVACNNCLLYTSRCV